MPKDEKLQKAIQECARLLMRVEVDYMAVFAVKDNELYRISNLENEAQLLVFVTKAILREGQAPAEMKLFSPVDGELVELIGDPDERN